MLVRELSILEVQVSEVHSQCHHKKSWVNHLQSKALGADHQYLIDGFHTVKYSLAQDSRATPEIPLYTRSTL